MALELTQQTIVILANQFNPSIFREAWLERTGVFNQGELTGNVVYTPMFCQVLGDVTFLVVNDRAQFMTSRTDGGRMAERSMVIVDELPQTLYSAIGVNFIWTFVPDGRSVADVSARLFLSPVYQLFDAATIFGLDGRSVSGAATLHTTITPSQDKFDIKFNYHFELSQNNTVDDARAALTSWNDKSCESADLIHRIFD
jgi:hypothetical protein